MSDKCYSSYLVSSWLRKENKKMKKVNKIDVRFTEKEYEYISQGADHQGVSKSTYVRQKLFNAGKQTLYTKELKECLENINDLVMRLKETADGSKVKDIADQLVKEVGREWLYLNK